MAAYAARQRGNVTRKQLLAEGITPKMIRRRRNVGALHVVFPGVYLVGHRAQPPLSRECAALLYCAPRALLSHRTAAWIWGLLAMLFDGVELTMVGRHRRSRPGLTVYSVASVERTEFRRYEGLPITSPSLTLLDLAGCVNGERLVSALNEARVQDLLSDEELRSTLAAHPNRRGAGALARLLASEESAFTTESEAEARCLKLMLAHGLRPDAAQARIGPYRVDFLYRAERLIVEVDGYRFHRTKGRFVADRRRRAELVARGYEVFPVTWEDLTTQAEATMQRLRLGLEQRRRRFGLPALRD